MDGVEGIEDILRPSGWQEAALPVVIMHQDESEQLSGQQLAGHQAEAGDSPCGAAVTQKMEAYHQHVAVMAVVRPAAHAEQPQYEDEDARGDSRRQTVQRISSSRQACPDKVKERNAEESCQEGEHHIMRAVTAQQLPGNLRYKRKDKQGEPVAHPVTRMDIPLADEQREDGERHPSDEAHGQHSRVTRRQQVAGHVVHDHAGHGDGLQPAG